MPETSDLTVASPAADLRATLDTLLGEHALLAMLATQKGYGGEADFEAIGAALDENSVEFSQAIGSVYGDQAAVRVPEPMPGADAPEGPCVPGAVARYRRRMRVFTVGHGTRPLVELVETLTEVGVATLVDVRRFPGSRRNPQFNQGPLADAAAEAGIAYRTRSSSAAG